MAAKKTEHGTDYTSVSPKGYVPALALDSGEVLTETQVVLQYIADQAAGSNLAPAPGSIERYRLQEWLGFIATELHKGFGPLFKPNTPDLYKPIVRENLERRFDYLEGQLGGRDYLAGSAFTIADAYCFTILNWINLHDIDLSRWPNLKAYVSRVATRPKVQEAMHAEGLLK